MNKYVTATWISVRTYGCEAGKSGFRDVKRANFIRNRRKSGLNNTDYPKLFVKENISTIIRISNFILIEM